LIHTGVGILEALLNQMFGNDRGVREEGINLLISKKLVKLMNGDVQYRKEARKSAFIITVELAAAYKSQYSK
ncbi:Histidine kinase-like ATPase, C-terminal domain containing protein, partial [Trema orientale]